MKRIALFALLFVLVVLPALAEPCTVGDPCPFAGTVTAGVLAAEQSVTDSVTLVDADGMSVQVEPDTLYEVEVRLWLTGDGDGVDEDAGFRFAWTVPSGARMIWAKENDFAEHGIAAADPVTPSDGVSDVVDEGDPLIPSGLLSATPGTLRVFSIQGLLSTDSGGTLQFRFAQGDGPYEVGNGAPYTCTMHSGSYVRVTTIGEAVALEAVPTPAP